MGNHGDNKYNYSFFAILFIRVQIYGFFFINPNKMIGNHIENEYIWCIFCDFMPILLWYMKKIMYFCSII